MKISPLPGGNSKIYKRMLGFLKKSADLSKNSKKLFSNLLRRTSGGCLIKTERMHKNLLAGISGRIRK